MVAFSITKSIYNAINILLVQACSFEENLTQSRILLIHIEYLIGQS